MLSLYIVSYIFIFILGAIIGSFLTAWIWRVHEGRSMMEKHSVCPHCQHALGPFDLIPIFSYILLGGRCRYCKTKVSPQYLIIELSTAILFVAGAWQIGTMWDGWSLVALLVSWAVMALLVALFVYDLHWGYLPDIWTIGGSILVLTVTIVAALLHQPLLWQPQAGLESGVSGFATTPTRLLAYSPTLASGLIAALFFLAIVWGSEKILHKPGMGLGDVKLALLMGLFLGFPGIVVAIYLAFILGAVLSLLLLAAKQKSFGQAIPFGPFLVAGTLIAWWVTPMVVGWYQQLLL